MSSTMLLKQQRILTTLRGAFLADTASMGTHWIYNPKDLLTTIADHVQQPEFHSPPSPSFYSSTEFPNHYLDGMLSPYGEQLLFTTEYVATNVATATDTLSGMGMSQAMYQWATTFGGRPDHATLTFIENIKANKEYPNCGADDDQVVPITCLYYGQNQLLNKIEEIIRVHQNNDIAVAFGIAAARILEAVLLVSTAPPSQTTSTSSSSTSLLQILDTCYANVKSDLESIMGDKNHITTMVLDAYQVGKNAASNEAYPTLDTLLLHLSHEKMKDQPDSPFYDLAGRSCALPYSFIGPIYQLYKLANSNNVTINENHYIDVIRENILAAGDTCSRGIYLGAVVAAIMEIPSSSSSSSDTATTTTTTTFDSLLSKVDTTVKNQVDTFATMIAAGKV